MKITAQEEYGLRCLLQLVQTDRNLGLTVKEIALREGLSSAYVEKLLRLMGRAGLIHSVRGMKGGYLLNRRPQEIMLGDVVRALGKVPSTDEICHRFTGNRTSCIHIDECCIRSVWETLTHVIQNFLDTTSLAELVGSEAKIRSTLTHRIMMQTRLPANKVL